MTARSLLAGAAIAALAVTAPALGAQGTLHRPGATVPATRSEAPATPGPRPTVGAPGTTVAVGTVLRADPGAWRSHRRRGVLFRWQIRGPEGWTEMAGGRSPRLVVPAEALGSDIRVAVAASPGARDPRGPRTSRPRRVVAALAPRDVTRPRITGTAVVGGRLSASTGTWRGRPRPRLSVSWLRDGSRIPGATGRVYVPVTADAGRTLTIQVGARNAAGSRAAVSPPVTVAAAPAPAPAPPPAGTTAAASSAPSAAQSPVVSGTPAPAGVLTTTTGTWSGSPAPALAASWQRDSGAGWTTAGSGTSYTVQPGDVGAQLRSVVTASSSAGTATATSDPVTIGPDVAPEVAGAPVVQGQAAVGSTLTSLPGTYTGTPAPVATAYAWQSSGDGGETWTPIPGADGPTLAVDAALVSDVIRLAETATNAAGSVTAYSDPTLVVPPVAPAILAAPTITGTAAIGGAVSTTGGQWAGAPAPEVTLQWQSSADGESWEDIAGATDDSLTIGADDLGLSIRVVATAVNEGGTAVAVSAPTAAVPGIAPSIATAPAISGGPGIGSVISATTGTWDGVPAPSPGDIAVQWEAAPSASGPWTPVAGGTTTTLTVPASPGRFLRVSVTATTTAGQGTAASAPVGPIVTDPPVNTVPPALAATAATTPDADGAAPVPGAAAPYLGMLAASAGTWTGGGAAPALSYQWIAQPASGGGWSPIAGATGPAFQPSCALVGDTVAVAVTATGGGGSATAQSPASQAFPVTDVDSDGDGLGNCAEISGSEITVTSGNQLTKTTYVAPASAATRAQAPLLVDTDADGLTDGDEVTQYQSDPGLPDTDADGLAYTPAADESPACGQAGGSGPCSSDWSEAMVYDSQPADADTDGDATSGGVVYPQLFDGREVSGSGTSPVLADTDGDAGFSLSYGALTDTTEVVFGDGSATSPYNPLVAQVPLYAMRISDDLDFELQYTVTSQNATTTSTTNATVATSQLAQHTGSDTTNTSEFNWNVKLGGGTSEKGPSFNLDGNVGGRYATTVTAFNDQTATQTLQSTAQQVLTQSSQSTVGYAADSTLSTTITVTNTGQVSYALQDPVFLAQVPDPDGPGEPLTLATLTPEASTLTECPGGTATDCTQTIGPGKAIALQVSDTSVPTQQLVRYMTSPGALSVTMAGTNIINAAASGADAGQPFSGTTGQAIAAQTGTLLIDPGDGAGGPVSFAVATMTDRDALGRLTGLPLAGALGVTGVASDTAPVPGEPGVTAFTQITLPGANPVPQTPLDLSDITPQGGSWLLVDGDAPTGPSANAAQTVLQQGDAVLLQFGQDSDADGLLNGAEEQLSTNPLAPDTDSDATAGACTAGDYGCGTGGSYASDFFETRVGWQVPLPLDGKASYPVTSSPLSCDADGDGLPEGPGTGTATSPCPKPPSGLAPESSAVPGVTGQGTDPNLPDTNLDGVTDGVEPFPEVLQPCPPGISCLPPTPLTTWAPFSGGPFQTGDTAFAMVPNPVVSNPPPGSDQVAALRGGASAGVTPFSITGQQAAAPTTTPPFATALATAADDSFWVASAPQLGTSTSVVTNTADGATLTFPPAPGMLSTGTCGASASPVFRIVDLAYDAQGELIALVQLQGTDGEWVGLRVVRWAPGDNVGEVYVADPADDTTCDLPYLDNTAIAPLPGPGGGVALVSPTGDAGDLQVTLLDQDLDVVTTWTVADPQTPLASGWGQFAGVAVDPQGYVYVSVGWGADPAAGGGQVLKFDSSGTQLSTVASSGAASGQVSGPDWVGASAGCRLVVEDVWNERFDVFAYPSGDAVDCPVAPAAPTSLAPPVVSGSPAVGDALACAVGSWSGDPLSFAYQWSAGGDAVAGATQSTYTITPGDAGEEVTCTVTASNVQGSASATGAGVTVPS